MRVTVTAAELDLLSGIAADQVPVIDSDPAEPLWHKSLCRKVLTNTGEWWELTDTGRMLLATVQPIQAAAES